MPVSAFYLPDRLFKVPVDMPMAAFCLADRLFKPTGCSGEEQSCTERCGEALLRQRRRNNYLEAIHKRGASLEEVRAAGDAWCWTEDPKKKLKVKVQVKELKAKDFCEKYGRSPLHLAVTMRTEGGRYPTLFPT